MAIEDYTVAVKIKAINELGLTLNTLNKQFTELEMLGGRFERRMRDIHSFASKAFVTGAVFAAPLVFAISKAAELQKQMLGIQLASRGTSKEMDTMRSAIEKISSQTIFSSVYVAKMGKIIATGTGLNATQITSIIPEYAKFADVQYLMKGMSSESAVTEAIRLAHTAGHYDAKSLAAYLDLLTKASLVVPGSLTEVGHALKYSQGISKAALGIDDPQMILLTAFLNRMGFAGSRGGTNLLAAMTRSIPGVFGSGLLKGKSAESLEAMGLVNNKGLSTVFSQGKFDPFKFIQGLTAYVQREFASHPEAIARQDIQKNFQHAFGTQGSRVVSLLTSPQALEQLRQIGETFAKMPTNAAMQQAFTGTVSQKWLSAKNNFVTLMTELGYQLLPAATKGLEILNNVLRFLIDMVSKLPDTWKDIKSGLVSSPAGERNILLNAGFSERLGIKGSKIASTVAPASSHNSQSSVGHVFLNGDKVGYHVAKSMSNGGSSPPHGPTGANYGMHLVPVGLNIPSSGGIY